MTIIASAGERISCTNGHELFELTKDAIAGEICSASQFKSLNEKLVAEFGKEMPRECPVCGGRWYLNVVSGTKFHFKDGWR